MKTFGKVLLTGALALGGLTVMNIETPKAHADEWDGCHYICAFRNGERCYSSGTLYTSYFW